MAADPSKNYDTFAFGFDSTEEGRTLVGTGNDDPQDYVPESHIVAMAMEYNCFSGQRHLLSSPETFRRARRGRRKSSSSSNSANHPPPSISGFVVYPWSAPYRVWWGLTVAAAAVTIFFETFVISFPPVAEVSFSGKQQRSHQTVECLLTGIFAVDAFLKFHLAFYNERDAVVVDKRLIAKSYRSSKVFWVDVIAVLPIDRMVALFVVDRAGGKSSSSSSSGGAYSYLALFRLARLLRTYRVRDFFAALRYDTRVSLVGLTMLRNLAAALVWTHLGACALYFVSRRSRASDDGGDSTTFLGDGREAMDEFESYTASLYWSVVTFSTVGYGDYSPGNSSERIACVLYATSNIVIQAWIIGSITLLLIKKDEKTGRYRDTLEQLDRYSAIHRFDGAFRKRLETQLQLSFHTRDVADESILRCFPVSTRRTVLRRLYGPRLSDTDLFRKVRPQFVDAFLSASRVEIFGPGEEILRRNDVSSDLYLLVGGRVEPRCGSGGDVGAIRDDPNDDAPAGTHRKAGDFINAIGFFTESPQIETVATVTVCKTLTISRSAYRLLAQDHPGSSGTILKNLLEKVQRVDATSNARESTEHPRAGSVFFRNGDPHRKREQDDPTTTEEESPRSGSFPGLASTKTAIEDLVGMHIEKQKDDHTTRFLFAASRGDTHAISVMCDRGFDPNSTDYDSRSALMVAAMKGNTEVVAKLLGCGADPNLADMHGSSALYEAVRNGHDDTMAALLDRGANLCMDGTLAASVLDRAVFDGDALLLRRLLVARIDVDASDYDKRGAVHLAAAEGNLPALRLLVEFGADPSARDRWGNTAEDEAERAEAGRVLAYLRSLRTQKQRVQRK